MIEGDTWSGQARYKWGDHLGACCSNSIKKAGEGSVHKWRG